MNFKEYFKQRLSEDLGSPELMDAMQAKADASGRDNSLKMADIAHSPYLYISDPNDPTGATPMRVPGARLHPRLSYALSSAAEFGRGIPPEDVAIIKDFIRQHGHFVGASDLGAPGERFRTDDPKSVLSNIFGTTRRRR